MTWVPAALTAAATIGGSLLNRKNSGQKNDTLSHSQRKALDRLLKGTSHKDLDIARNPLYKSGSSYLQELLSNKQGAFDRFEAPIKNQFYEEIVPEIAERFTANDAQKSSAFQQAFARAGEDLSLKLASLRGGLQNDALGSALQYAGAPAQGASNRLGLALGTPALQSRAPSAFQSLLGNIGGGVSNALGNYGGKYLGQSLFGSEAPPSSSSGTTFVNSGPLGGNYLNR